MIESVKNMPIPGVDGDELSVTIGTGARTGFGVIRSNKNFGAPVMFNAGQVIKKPKGPAATRFSVNLEYRDGYTFTGDYSKDQAFVRDVLGSEYQLLPTGRGSYQLVILPFFKDIEPMEERRVPTGREYTGTAEEQKRAELLMGINEPFLTRIKKGLEGVSP